MHLMRLDLNKDECYVLIISYILPKVDSRWYAIEFSNLGWCMTQWVESKWADARPKSIDDLRI